LVKTSFIALAKSVDNKLEVQRALATIGRTHFCHAEALTTNNRVLYDKSLSSSKEYYEKSLKLSERYVSFCNTSLVYETVILLYLKNRLKGEVSERDYMQMNSRLYLNLGLVCDLQSQDSAAINFFKKVILTIIK
jgi:NF-kappa-B inhibitor-like protein 2